MTAFMPTFITHKTLEKCLKGQLCSGLMRQGAESKAIFVLMREKNFAQLPCTCLRSSTLF